MARETLAFYGLLIPVMIAAGYDALVGVAVIVVVLAVVPNQHKPISEVFFEVHNATGFTFGGAGVYAVLIGLLMAQYTYTGYDASAHVAEFAEKVSQADRAKFIEVAESELLALHEGNFARYQVTPAEYRAWQEVWARRPSSQRRSDTVRAWWCWC